MRKRQLAFLLCFVMALSLLPLPAIAVTTNGKKIYLSPSDQTANSYAYGGTTEAIQCRRIANALEIALKRNGFQVKNNQTDSMEDRVKESDAWGADLHVPLHTNAFNGEVAGTRIYTWDKTGKGRQCAKKVYDYLAPLTPGESEGLYVADFYEIRVPVAPTVYIESEFHDVPDVAKWIIENTENIAEAICHGICDYFSVAYIAPAPEKSEQTITADDINATYGDTDISIAALTDGDGTLTYEVIDGKDVVSVDNDGKLTILKAGTATICITASATDSYEMATKDVTVTIEPAQRQIAGDINDNGYLDDDDLTKLLRHVAKIELITDSGELERADVDGIGGINAADVTALATMLNP